MSAMVDTYAAKNAPYTVPQRKPLPSGPPPAIPVVGNPNAESLHSRTRTSSSSALPPSYASAPVQSGSAYPSQPSMNQFIQGQPARRTLSNATTSTSSSGGGGPAIAPVRTPSALRRSGSGRNSTSSIAPTSYVALMRKQKATVWSERAQHEDPRLLAAQRQAKMRATMEVVGGRSSTQYLGGRGSTPTNNQGSVGLRSKIRHHGAQKTIAAGGNMAGAGVPMRLSANEVDGDSDEESYGYPYSGAGGSAYHRRTGSGRSSLGSAHRDGSSQFLVPAPGAQRQGSGSTPPSGQGSSPTEMERLDEETPVPGHATSSYFQHTKTGLSQGSSSGGSRENSFGQLAPMPERKEEETEKKRKSTQDELMRRGSVDERSMTMSGVRLFVANPDLSD